MKLRKIVKTIINLAPVIYPVIKKIINHKKSQNTGFRINARD